MTGEEQERKQKEEQERKRKKEQRYEARGTIRLKIKDKVVKAYFCPAASSTAEDKCKNKYAVFLASGNTIEAVARPLAEGLVKMDLSKLEVTCPLVIATLNAAATTKSCVEVEVEEVVGQDLKLVSLHP